MFKLVSLKKFTELQCEFLKLNEKFKKIESDLQEEKNKCIILKSSVEEIKEEIANLKAKNQITEVKKSNRGRPKKVKETTNE